MCVACFTTAQLATVGAVSARWWWVNRFRSGDEPLPAEDIGPADRTSDQTHEEPVPVA